jgi:cell wall assembly regulator SMI1
MTIPINVLARFNGNPPAAKEVVEAMERSIGCKLPSDFRECLAHRIGGNGFVGTHAMFGCARALITLLQGVESR